MGIQNQSYWKSDLTSVTFDLNFYVIFNKKHVIFHISVTLWICNDDYWCQIVHKTYIYIYSNTTICMKPNTFYDIPTESTV